MLDIDRDGTITFYEFLQMMADFKYNTQNTEKGLKSMFKAFDTNGDGVLSKEELSRNCNFFSKTSKDIRGAAKSENFPIFTLEVVCWQLPQFANMMLVDCEAGTPQDW